MRVVDFGRQRLVWIARSTEGRVYATVERTFSRGSRRFREPIP